MGSTYNNKLIKIVKKIRAVNHLGGKCQKCGNDNIFELSFHHLRDKVASISNLIQANKRIEEILEECNKCTLLCENCHAELHYNKKLNDNIRKQRLKKQIYLEYKNTKCEICGYNKCNGALEFHHSKVEDKLFQISISYITAKTVADLSEAITKELDKCQVLCANCHNYIHSSHSFYEDNKKEINEKVISYKQTQKAPTVEIINMYKDGIRQVDIAKHFNLNKSTIFSILKRNGLTGT